MPETSAALIDQLVYIDNFLNNGDTPNLDVDGQLLLDLAAFADELFIFPDEEKPARPDDDDDDNDHKKNPLDFGGMDGFHDDWFDHAQDASGNTGSSSDHHRKLDAINERTKLAKLSRNGYATPETANTPEDNGQALQPLQDTASKNIPDLTHLPKFPVPPGAKLSLQQAGLLQNQIDLLSALIAQHQSLLGNAIPTSDRNTPVAAPNPRSLYSVTPTITPTLASSVPDPLGQIEIDNVPARGNPLDSPGSMYSSGYSSGTSALLTPQMRGSVSAATGAAGQQNSGQPTDLDKRRRNTAASARFRIKKKLKEKEMETKIDQLDEMIKKFELKISELEMENRLLKNLIIEKGNRNSDQELKLLKERVRHQT